MSVEGLGHRDPPQQPPEPGPADLHHVEPGGAPLSALPLHVWWDQPRPEEQMRLKVRIQFTKEFLYEASTSRFTQQTTNNARSFLECL